MSICASKFIFQNEKLFKQILSSVFYQTGSQQKATLTLKAIHLSMAWFIHIQFGHMDNIISSLNWTGGVLIRSTAAVIGI